MSRALILRIRPVVNDKCDVEVASRRGKLSYCRPLRVGKNVNDTIFFRRALSVDVKRGIHICHRVIRCKLKMQHCLGNILLKLLWFLVERSR